MSILKQFNKGKLFDYNKEEKREFVTFKDLNKDYPEKVFPVRALFINTKGHYGDAPVIVTDAYMVNAPQHLLSTVKDMIKSDELVDLVNEGKVGFSLYEYEGQKGKAYSCNWVEIN